MHSIEVQQRGLKKAGRTRRRCVSGSFQKKEARRDSPGCAGVCCSATDIKVDRGRKCFRVRSSTQGSSLRLSASSRFLVIAWAVPPSIAGPTLAPKCTQQALDAMYVQGCAHSRHHGGKTSTYVGWLCFPQTQIPDQAGRARRFCALYARGRRFLKQHKNRLWIRLQDSSSASLCHNTAGSRALLFDCSTTAPYICTYIQQ